MIIVRTVFNPRSIPCPLRIPGYDATIPLITIAPSSSLDLLTVITEDQLIGVQETLDILIAGGALTVVNTFDTATLEQGYDGGGNTLAGVISNDSTQLTTSWSFLNFQTAGNAELFFKTVGGSSVNGHVGWDSANTYINSSTGVQILTSEFSSPKTWLFDSTGTLTTPGAIDLTSHKIVNVLDPTSAQDAATKSYVDTALSSKLSLSGGAMSGNLDMGQNQLVNAVIQTGASEPGSPVEGQLYYRNDTHQLELWNGSAWVIIG